MPDSAQQRLLDLQRHQVELEMQNEVLRQTQSALEAKLRSSEQCFQDIARASADWIWEVNAAGVYSFASDNVLDLLGYTPAEIVGKTPFDLMPPEEAERVGVAFAAIVGRREPFRELDNTLCHKDGSLRQVQTNGVPILSADGELLGYRGIDRDITERKFGESQLRKFVQAVEQSSESIVITNIDAQIEYVNNAFLLATGYRREEVIGQNPRMLNSGSTPPETYAALWDALCHGHSWKGQFHNRRKDGSEYDEFAIITPLREVDGAISHYVAVKEDITEKKQQGEELDHYRQHLKDLVAERTAELTAAVAHTRLIIDSSAEGILQLDETGRIGLVNPAACQMLGYSPAELLGRDVHEAIHCPPGTAASHTPCSLGVAMRAGRTLREDAETFWRADGRPLPVTVATHPMRKGDIVIGAVMSFSDSTKRRSLEEAREAALEASELLAQSRSEFLANMSHEIRTPLNGVLGMAQIGYRDNIAGGKSKEMFANILASGQLLMAIINDILDMSKIEAGQLVVESIPLDPGQTLDAAVALMADKALQKGIRPLVEKAPDLPVAILGDPTRISQILLNLLSNAIKFTAHGEIRLAALCANDQLVFRISDPGIGMTAEQLEELFKPFRQGDSTITRKYGGTGLGLTISRKLAQLMGGDIHVSSEAGSGSTFELRLPCIETAAAVSPSPTDFIDARGMRLKGLRILVAEDNEFNQMVLEDMLTGEGAELEMVGNGRLAVDSVAKNPAAFDLVLMDVQMPEMDGREATQRIRVIAPALPVIGQTAHVLPAEHERCRAAGMIDLISKPLNMEALIRIVLRHSGRTGVTGLASPPPEERGASAPGGLINWEKLEARYADRPAFLVKLLGITLKTHSGAPVLIRAAASVADMAQLSFLAHTASGTGGNLFADELQAQAQATESAIRDGNPAAAAHADQLAQKLDAVMTEIRSRLA